MFCKNCGNKVEKNVSFCPSCGSPLNEEKKKAGKQEEANVTYVIQEPKKNTGTAGMVLGIIAIVYALITLVSITTEDFKISALENSRDIVAFAIGVVLVQTVLSCVGLPLSISSLRKGKNGKNISGTILCAATIVLSIIYFIYVVSTYS